MVSYGDYMCNFLRNAKLFSTAVAPLNILTSNILGLNFSMLQAMAPHSSTPAWKIPWMEEPGRLQSMGSLRVRHDCATSLSLFTFMHQRRKWLPTPVFLPGESQGRVGCRLWGRTESDTTEATQQQQQPTVAIFCFFGFFIIVATLVDIKWCFIVVLIFFSLMREPNTFLTELRSL